MVKKLKRTLSLRKIAAPTLLASSMAWTISGCSTNSVKGSAPPTTMPVSGLLQSAGSLAFGPDNVLFVGDSKAGKVHAVEFEVGDFDDQSDYVLGRAQSFEGRTLVAGIDQQIADLVGADVSEIHINDMVVHTASKQVFLSVERGDGPGADAIILKVDRGQLKLVDVDDSKHSSIEIGSIPTEETLEFGQEMNSLAITDIDYFEGEIFIAGISNEEFASKLRRASWPFDGEVSTSSIEIWHAVHAQYETRAPIITQNIRVLDGEPTLIAVYACTPIVKIPLASLVDGAKVRGNMIGEMGYGNTPIDMVGFNNPMDGSDYVLVTNTNRSAVQIPLQAIGAAADMPNGEGVQPNFSVAGVAQYPMPLSGTLHLALADPQWAMTIRRNPENLNQIDLHTLPVPFFFDRADHVVEMNWEGGPDPFGYGSMPPVKW